MLNNNTICAIATAPGGAIGIIRISGSEAISIADRIFRPIGSSLSLSERKAYTLAFGNIVNSDGDVVDEVLVSIFRALTLIQVRTLSRFRAMVLPMCFSRLCFCLQRMVAYLPDQASLPSVLS